MNKAPRYMREYASSIKKSAEGRKKDEEGMIIEREAMQFLRNCAIKKKGCFMMTKQEKFKCEKLAEEALRNLENSNIEYAKYERLKKEEKKTDAECSLRNADQLLGYAQGIYQALAVLGYQSEKMKALTDLL